jgi:hypothetical protein
VFGLVFLTLVDPPVAKKLMMKCINFFSFFFFFSFQDNNVKIENDCIRQT